MKSITTSILALTAIGLCAVALLRVQAGGNVEAKLNAMQESWALAKAQNKGIGASWW